MDITFTAVQTWTENLYRENQNLKIEVNSLKAENESLRQEIQALKNAENNNNNSLLTSSNAHAQESDSNSVARKLIHTYRTLVSRKRPRNEFIDDDDNDRAFENQNDEEEFDTQSTHNTSHEEQDQATNGNEGQRIHENAEEPNGIPISESAIEKLAIKQELIDAGREFEESDELSSSEDENQMSKSVTTEFLSSNISRPSSSNSSREVTRPSKHPVSGPKRVKNRNIVEVGGLEEIEEKYRPSAWLSELMPRRTPYYPQLGDDVVYFRQGHEMYISEVNAHEIYPISKKDLKNLPWCLNPDLPPEVSARVVSIEFELKPPRLVCLKLAVTDWDTGELAGTNINNVVYHDVSDVVDFLILRQHYNKSIRHEWKMNDRFRCLIDKDWWLGTIQSIKPISPQFPDSKFLCYKVFWDNKDEERMSPWDIEEIPPDFEIPKGRTKGESGFPASDADLRSGMYEVNERDWPPYGHQDTECIKVRTILENVMRFAIAEPFLTPVDLNAYPMYAYEVEYPMDLSTIKSRLENHFYRRMDVVKFDIEFIAKNAEKFYQPDSEIVKQARMIRDICLEVIRRPGRTNVTSVYHKLLSNFTWIESQDEESRRKSKP